MQTVKVLQIKTVNTFIFCDKRNGRKKMTSWTMKEIGAAVEARNDFDRWKDVHIEGVAFDTRHMTPGMLFVPLKDIRDGHAFIEEAMKKGAVATLWSNSIEEAPKDFPVLQVEDTLEALQQWANVYLKEVGPKVVGITGSNGKTTTKDMTEAVVSSRYRTHKTQGNFNNNIGLPMTLLEMPRETEVVILEMGMSQPGEIKLLSELAEPDIAVITMIGESHIEFFGNRQGIADAKMEIITGLKKGGTFIYPGEEPLLKDLTKVLTQLHKKTFGKTSSQDAYPLEIESGLKQTTFRMNKAPECEITLPVLGTYNVQNALAALLVGEALNISIEKGAEKLRSFQLTENRLQWLEGINQSHILNDAYNASPSSMKAVIRDFSQIDVTGKKKVLLGDILELGELSEDLHRSLKEVFNSSQIDEVILFGQAMAALKEELLLLFPKEKVIYFSDNGNKEELISYLKKTLEAEDYLLIKSSLGTGLLEVVEKLKANDSVQNK